MKKRLLVVEDVFQLRLYGLVLAPEVSPEKNQSYSDLPIPIELTYPDGSTRIVQAKLSWIHFNPGGYKLICSLLNVEKKEIPIGTEVWQ